MRVKVAGNELFFCYILHLFIFALGPWRSSFCRNELGPHLRREDEEVGGGVQHLHGKHGVHRLPHGTPAQHGLPGGLPPALRSLEAHKDQVRMLPRIMLGLQASAKERDCPDNFCQGAGGLRTSRKSERKENIFRVYRKLILTV